VTIQAFIGLGSNLGDRHANCAAAWEAIGRLPGSTLIRVSPLIETSPRDGVEGGPFLNGVAELSTDLSARALLRQLQAIEVSLGRPAGHAPGGARTIDLDILLYGELRVRAPDLEIPHPRMATRRFVLEPLAALAPELRHPALHLTIAELLRRCDRVPGEPS